MILLTGGSGLLGRHLKPLLDCIAPSHDEFDILAPVIPPGVHLIVHAAAYTDVDGAERDPSECYAVNVTGTQNLLALGLPLVYISTEYVFDGDTGNYAEDAIPRPLNVYAETKFIGEIEVMRAERTLIVRTLFKPRPFEHERACTDQFTSGDYADVIATLIAKAIGLFEDGRLEGVIHIGTGRKSTFDLAKQTREVSPIERKDICTPLPRDTSLNLAKWASTAK
ncbi:MAG: SDR family oxidoreductase [Burkholderiales bacterium]